MSEDFNENYGTPRRPDDDRSRGNNQNNGYNGNYGDNRSNAYNGNYGNNQNNGYNGNYGNNQNNGYNGNYGDNRNNGYNGNYGGWEYNRNNGYNGNGYQNENYYNRSDYRNYGNGYNYQEPRKFAPFIGFDVWAKERRDLRVLSDFGSMSIICYIILSMILSSAMAVFSRHLISSGTYDSIAPVWNSSSVQSLIEILYSIIVVGLPFFVIGYIYKNSIYDFSVPLGKPKGGRNIPLLIFAGIAGCFIANIITSYFDMFVKFITGWDPAASLSQDTNPDSVFSWVLYFLATAVVPPLVEEMALRGTIMQPLRKYGDMFALLVSAMLFGLMHCNLAQIPFAFLAGIAIGYVTLATGSLWAGMAVHFANNFMSFLSPLISNKFGEEGTAIMVFNIVYYVIAFVGVVCFIIYILDKKRRYVPKKYEYINDGGKFKYMYHHPMSARISNSGLFGQYITTPGFIIAFILIIYETVTAAVVS